MLSGHLSRKHPVAYLHFSYGQFMSLFSKTVAERTKPGQRQDVEEKCTVPPALL